MKKYIFYLIAIFLMINCSFKSENDYLYFHQCIEKKENNKKIYSGSIETTKIKSCYNLYSKIEKRLIKKRFLLGTEKKDYENFIINLNDRKQIDDIKKLLKLNLNSNELNFLKSTKLYQEVLKCFREEYHKTNDNYIKKQIEIYLEKMNEMQLFVDKQNALLLKLIKGFDDNFFKNIKNRCIILHQIIFVYLNLDEKQIYY